MAIVLLFFPGGERWQGRGQRSARAVVSSARMRLSSSSLQSRSIRSSYMQLSLQDHLTCRRTRINDLKPCPNVFPAVQERWLLAFSVSTQLFHRFNSESQVILVFGTLKQSLWQKLPKTQ